MSKMIKRGIAVLMGILMLSAFIYLGGKEYPAKEENAKMFHHEYSKVDEDNVFVYKSASEVIGLLKTGTGVIFLGTASNSWCQAYAPMLDEVAKDIGFKGIYYLDIEKDKHNNTLDYREILALINRFSAEDEENQRINIPNVIFVKNGIIVASDNETSNKTGNGTNAYWTNKAKALLKGKLYNYFAAISK